MGRGKHGVAWASRLGVSLARMAKLLGSVGDSVESGTWVLSMRWRKYEDDFSACGRLIRLEVNGGVGSFDSGLWLSWCLAARDTLALPCGAATFR